MKLAKAALFGAAITLSAGMALGTGAGAQSSARTDSSVQKPVTGIQWNSVVTRKDSAHIFGNPDAQAKLTEYVSYTCPHCANFVVQGDPALKLIYIPSGKVSVEIRHVIRDPIDWTAAVLAQCGEPEQFAQNHDAFMRTQKDWLPKLSTATQAQRARWQSSDPVAARRAIASDLGFEEIMERRGYSRVEIDRCLADGGTARAIAVDSILEAKRMGVSGTPSFALNGTLLEGTHNWPTLEKDLNAFFDAQKNAKLGE